MIDPRRLSPYRRWVLRRNLAIYALHRQGWSQRTLADVFLLARSRIHSAIKALKAEDRERKDRGKEDLDPVLVSRSALSSRVKSGRRK